MKYIFVIGIFILLIIAPFISGELIFDFSNSQNLFILNNIRIPRILTTILVGGGLAICGASFQSMFRNALATPYTLGIASGASLGAAIALTSGFVFSVGIFDSLSLFGYLGAGAAMFLVYFFSTLKEGMQMSLLLLAGVAIGMTCSSGILFAQYLSDDLSTARIVRWLMGGVDVVGYETPLKIVVPVLLGAIYLSIRGKELDLLSIGEEFAISRGLNVQKFRIQIYFVTSIIVAAIVSECGPIGFVGLMVPHMCRSIFGRNSTGFLPLVFLGGAGFLVSCDLLSRLLIDIKIPIGIITSVLGGPFFIFLLLRKRR